jgi:hypothetical protein
MKLYFQCHVKSCLFINGTSLDTRIKQLNQVLDNSGYPELFEAFNNSMARIVLNYLKHVSSSICTHAYMILPITWTILSMLAGVITVCSDLQYSRYMWNHQAWIKSHQPKIDFVPEINWYVLPFRNIPNSAKIAIKSRLMPKVVHELPPEMIWSLSIKNIGIVGHRINFSFEYFFT